MKGIMPGDRVQHRINKKQGKTMDTYNQHGKVQVLWDGQTSAEEVSLRCLDKVSNPSSQSRILATEFWD